LGVLLGVEAVDPEFLLGVAEGVVSVDTPVLIAGHGLVCRLGLHALCGELRVDELVRTVAKGDLYW